MRTFDEMVKAGKVSVWVGDITVEDDLVVYVDDGAFGLDYDFQVYSRARRELCAGSTVLPLEKLVQGFSWWENFNQACIRRAKELGISGAKCMVVFYAFEYVTSPKVNPGAPLRFVGAFDF